MFVRPVGRTGCLSFPETATATLGVLVIYHRHIHGDVMAYLEVATPPLIAHANIAPYLYRIYSTATTTASSIIPSNIFSSSTGWKNWCVCHHYTAATAYLREAVDNCGVFGCVKGTGSPQPQRKTRQMSAPAPLI